MPVQHHQQAATLSPYHEKTTCGSPLFPWKGFKIHIAKRGFVPITSQIPDSNSMSEWHAQTNGYITTEVSLLYGPHIGHNTRVPTLTVQTLHLHLHTGVKRRVRLTLTFKFHTVVRTVQLYQVIYLKLVPTINNVKGSYIIKLHAKMFSGSPHHHHRKFAR
jgi:hypothetical protein